MDLAQAALVHFVLGHMRVKTNVCTLQRHERGYSLERRTVPDHNLIYVTRGRPVWVIEDEAYPLEPGLMVIVPPGVTHHAWSRTQRVTIGSLHVEATLPGVTVPGSGNQDVFDLLRPPRTIRFTAGTPLDTYLRGALPEFDRPSYQDARLMLASWARMATIELFRQAHAQGLLQPRPIDPVVAKVLDHLTQRVDRSMAMNDLAAFAGYTPQHLNRLFRRVLGVTPLQYLTRLRMDRAAALVIEGRLSVRGVAEAVGYEDPYYFSRAFRQHFGRSPAQYRESAGSDSPSPDSEAPFPYDAGDR